MSHTPDNRQLQQCCHDVEQRDALLVAPVNDITVSFTVLAKLFAPAPLSKRSTAHLCTAAKITAARLSRQTVSTQGLYHGMLTAV